MTKEIIVKEKEYDLGNCKNSVVILGKVNHKICGYCMLHISLWLVIFAPKFEFGGKDDGRMYSLGEVNFIQGMLDLGNCKNSVGLKPNAELRKDAKAPSYNIGTELGIS